MAEVVRWPSSTVQSFEMLANTLPRHAGAAIYILALDPPLPCQHRTRINNSNFPTQYSVLCPTLSPAQKRGGKGDKNPFWGAAARAGFWANLARFVWFVWLLRTLTEFCWQFYGGVTGRVLKKTAKRADASPCPSAQPATAPPPPSTQEVVA